jgi:hypothetical protein
MVSPHAMQDRALLREVTTVVVAVDMVIPPAA